MKTSILLLLFGACVIMAGCYYHNDETLHPCSFNPATTRVTYSTTDTTVGVKDILDSYGCTSTRCHGGPLSNGGGINLSTYNGVKKVALESSSRGPSTLNGAITHAANYTPMPQGDAKMTDCDIKKIKVWIDAGAPN